MATHRITVQIGGTSPLADTEANRQRVFIFTGATPVGSATHIGGNLGAKVPPIGQHHFDLNHPRVPGAIAVSAYSPQTYDSTDLQGRTSLVSQLSTAIEKGYVIVQDDSAAIPGQTGAAASMAAAGSNVIVVTGLTGMTAASVGRTLTFSGAATGANNGSFVIVTFTNATTVSVASKGAPGNDANNGALTWTEFGVVLDRADLTALI